MTWTQLNELFDRVTSTGGPEQGQCVKVTYTLVAAGTSSAESIVGNVTDVSHDEFSVTTGNDSTFRIECRGDSLHVYRLGGRLGRVADISVLD